MPEELDTGESWGIPAAEAQGAPPPPASRSLRSENFFDQFDGEEIELNAFEPRETPEDRGGIREGGDGPGIASGDTQGIRAQGETVPGVGEAGGGVSGGQISLRHEQKEILLRHRPRSAGSGCAAGGVVGAGEATPQFESIIERLIEAAPDHTAFGQGRLTKGQAVGQYKRTAGVAQVRDVAVLETVTHELVHSYEGRVVDIDALKKTHKAELDPLAYAGGVQ